jgi:hypothetical protein
MSLDYHSRRFQGCRRIIWRNGYVAECAPGDGLESLFVFLNVPFGLEGGRTATGFEGRSATIGCGLQRRWLDGGPSLLGPAVAYHGGPCWPRPGQARPSRSSQAPGVIQAGGRQRMRRRPRPFERAPGRTGFLRALMSAPRPNASTGDHRRTAAGPTEIVVRPAPACFLPCHHARRLWTGQLKPSWLDSWGSNGRPKRPLSRGRILSQFTGGNTLHLPMLGQNNDRGSRNVNSLPTVDRVGKTDYVPPVTCYQCPPHPRLTSFSTPTPLLAIGSSGPVNGVHPSGTVRPRRW